MNFGVVKAITQKDVVDAIRNRYLLTALVTPLFVAILFRFLLPGVNSPKLFTVVVHDTGNSTLVAELRKSPQLSVVAADSAEVTASEVEKRNAIGGVVVPLNFDSDVTVGKQPQLTIYNNNTKSAFEQTAFRRLLDQQVQALVKHPEPARMVWIDIDETSEQSPGINLEQMLLPLLLILTFGMTGALVVPLLLVEEKEKRTLDFLLASPAGLREIIAGKALTGVVYSVLIAGLLLVINRQLVGNWPLTILSALLGIVFVVAIGLLMGSLLNNTMQVNTWASSVLIVLLAPSFPSLGLTSYLNTAMRFVPTYYLNEALKLSFAGNVSPKIWGHLAVVLVCSLIAFAATAWALRRQHN